MRLRSVLGALALGSLAFATSASATDVYVDYDDRFGEYYVYIVGSNKKNDIEVTKVRGGVEITDSREPVSIEDAQPECDQLAPKRVVCDFPETLEAISGRGGDDTIRLSEGFSDVRHVRGQAGSDRLLGSSNGDPLEGGDGDDLLKGRGGPDVLGATKGRYSAGDPGHDTFLGGAGRDRIASKDKTRDEVIDCGSGGGDRAKIDRKQDPDPAGCEDVRRVN